MPSFIFTNHALERMQKRQVTQSSVELVLRNPDTSFPGKKPGTIKFIKVINDRNHQVVARFLENEKKWLVLSVWVRGEDDFNWVEWVVLAPFKMLWWIGKELVKIFR